MTSRLARLRYLNVGDNPLGDLPSAIRSLTGLAEPRAENAHLPELPTWIPELDKLDLR